MLLFLSIVTFSFYWKLETSQYSDQSEKSLVNSHFEGITLVCSLVTATVTYPVVCRH